MQKKISNFSLRALTSILILSEEDYLFDKKLKVSKFLQEWCKFETDPQNSLRFLQLIHISISKKIAVQQFLEMVEAQSVRKEEATERKESDEELKRRNEIISGIVDSKVFAKDIVAHQGQIPVPTMINLV